MPYSSACTLLIPPGCRISGSFSPEAIISDTCVAASAVEPLKSMNSMFSPVCSSSHLVNLLSL